MQTVYKLITTPLDADYSVAISPAENCLQSGGVTFLRSHNGSP